MKTWLASLLVALIPNLAHASADQVFDGYVRFYASQEGAVFKPSDAHKLQLFSVTSNATAAEKNIFVWKGVADGKEFSFSLIDRSIYESDDEGPKESFVLNGKKFYFVSAKLFPGEFGKLDARSASLFINKKYLCLEGVSFSASGTAQRHVDVYLLSLEQKGAVKHFYKLPSLFASCLGVRRGKDGFLIFPKIAYRYVGNTDAPVGVTIQDYTFRAGRFVSVGAELKANFVEPDNVYKFRLL